MLPTGKEKQKLIKEGKKKKIGQDKIVKGRELLAQKEVEEKAYKKFREEVDQVKKYIEDDILGAIDDGNKETSLINGDKYNSNYQKAWKQAVKELEEENPEYTFEILNYRTSCDNACEAANVDYVTYKSWEEDVEELKITW